MLNKKPSEAFKGTTERSTSNNTIFYNYNFKVISQLVYELFFAKGINLGRISFSGTQTPTSKTLISFMLTILAHKNFHHL
jgi:hypothetical protein